MELTDVCNFQCIYCGSNITHIGSAKRIKSLADEISELNCVGFSGGEPTLPACFSTLVEGVKYIKRKGSYTEVLPTVAKYTMCRSAQNF